LVGWEAVYVTASQSRGGKSLAEKSPIHCGDWLGEKILIYGNSDWMRGNILMHGSDWRRENFSCVAINDWLKPSFTRK
jgi:hypothetical protein